MRIHSDKLEARDIYAAAQNVPDVTVDYMSYGSRKRARAFEVSLRGYGDRHTRRPNDGYYGADRSGYAATWHDWGWFLAQLFELDPGATMAYYADKASFHEITCGTFGEPLPSRDEQRAVKVNAERTVNYAAVAR